MKEATTFITLETVTRTLFVRTSDARISKLKSISKNRLFTTLGYTSYGIHEQALTESMKVQDMEISKKLLCCF